jgi:hypothetical protein
VRCISGSVVAQYAVVGQPRTAVAVLLSSRV